MTSTEMRGSPHLNTAPQQALILGDTLDQGTKTRKRVMMFNMYIVHTCELRF